MALQIKEVVAEIDSACKRYNAELISARERRDAEIASALNGLNEAINKSLDEKIPIEDEFFADINQQLSSYCERYEAETASAWERYYAEIDSASRNAIKASSIHEKKTQ